MLMSVCLQSIVDELLCQKDDHDFTRLTVSFHVEFVIVWNYKVIACSIFRLTE